jgi:hypothetical protein
MTDAECQELRHAITIKALSWNELADYAVELLDERDNGRRITEDRFDGELAELRDGLLEVTQLVTRHIDAVQKLQALDVTMLGERIDGVAHRVECALERLDAHSELLGQHSFELVTHTRQLSARRETP